MTGDEFDYGTTVLAPLRHDPLGPTTISIERAVAAGNRHRRNHTIALAAATAAIVALTAGTAVVTLPHRGGAQTVAASTTTVSPPSTTTSNLTAPAYFDPHVNEATVHLDGFTTTATSATQKAYSVTLRSATGSVAQLVLFGKGAGATDERLYVWDPSRSPTVDPINGQPAYGRSCGAGCVVVAWHWAPAAWAEAIVRLSRADIDPADTAKYAIAGRVAVGTSITARPLVLPAEVPAPAGAQLLSVEQIAIVGPSAGEVGLTYAARGSDPARPELWRCAWVRLTWDPIFPVKSTLQVGGHSARWTTVDGVRTLRIFYVAGGWAVDVGRCSGGVLDTDADILAYAATIQAVADPNDMTTWVTPG